MRVDLYKVHLNEGAHSRVSVGSSAVGEFFILRKANSLDALKKDDEIFVTGLNYIKTSPVQEIIPYEDGLTIRTKTSTYKLEEVKEEKEEDGSKYIKGDAK